jgi:hypothetical protein
VGPCGVPARITDKQAAQSWDWCVGPVEMRHGVEARSYGYEVRVELSGQLRSSSRCKPSTAR